MIIRHSVVILSPVVRVSEFLRYKDKLVVISAMQSKQGGTNTIKSRFDLQGHWSSSSLTSIWPQLKQVILELSQWCKGHQHHLGKPSPWSHIAVDFVTGLTSSYSNTAIITFPRPYTSSHYRNFLPQLRQVMPRYGFRLYGFPRDIISERGPQFTSQVWTAFCTAQSATVSLSSGFHPPVKWPVWEGQSVPWECFAVWLGLSSCLLEFVFALAGVCTQLSLISASTLMSPFTSIYVSWLPASFVWLPRRWVSCAS